jgi:O-antigen ligase
MLKDNSFLSWIFGNGIGSFRTIYPQYATSQFDAMVFPHFHPFELLFENGLIGLLLVSAGLVYLLVMAIRKGKTTNHKSASILNKCMIVVFLSWLFHSNLTFPFYSKYTQYSLGFILGTLLVILERSNGQSEED